MLKSSVGAAEKSEGSQEAKPKLPPQKEMVVTEVARRKIESLKAERAKLPKPGGRARLLLTRRIYYLLNNEKCRKWDREHPELVQLKSRAWYLNNKERNKQRTYRNRAKNPEATRAAVRDWHRRNAKRRLAYRKRFRATHPEFAIADRLRRRMNRALSDAGAVKSAGTLELTGCDVVFLKQWIERQFVNGMNWNNRREWHIDHIVGVRNFNLCDPEEQRIAFNYRNLQPLSAFENQSKQDKLPTPLPSWLPASIAERILARQSTTKTYAHTKT